MTTQRKKKHDSELTFSDALARASKLYKDLSTSQTKQPDISEFSDTLSRVNKLHKSLYAEVAEANKAAEEAEERIKKFDTILDDLCPAACTNLASFKFLATKFTSIAIESKINPAEVKFNKYCSDRYVCDDKNGGRLSLKEETYDHRHAYNEQEAGTAGRTSDYNNNEEL